MWLKFQFIQGGLRECHEETGLDMSPEQFVSEDIKLLALWEVCCLSVEIVDTGQQVYELSM